LIDKYGTETGTFLDVAEKFFYIRFNPADVWIGVLMIIIGCLLFLIGTILLIPDKYISTKYKLVFEKINSKIETKTVMVTLLSIILFSSLFYLFIDFNEPISHLHSFKQTEVASNIHFYVEEGFKLEESFFNKNIDLKMFSYPLYHWTAAEIAILSGLDVVQSGRILNILIFIITFILFYKLLSYLKIKELSIVLILLMFAFSPLGLYFYRAVHPDPMAILFTFASVFLFIKYESEDKPINILLSISFGILACLINNPIYLIGFISIIFYRIYFSKTIKGLFQKDFLIYSSIIVLTVVYYTLTFYKFNANATNGMQYLAPDFIFGPLVQRIELTPYLLLLLWNSFEVTNPIFFVLAVFGAGLSIKSLGKSSEKANAIFIGYLPGIVITIMIFFHVFQRHDYYHLSFILITSFFAVYGFSYILKKLAESKNNRSVIVSTLLIIIFICIQFLGLALLKIPTEPEKEVFEAGNYIQKNIDKKSFVFYTMSPDNEGWNPTYLFHTRRIGYNISLLSLGKEHYMESVISRHIKDFDKFYLYVPNDYYLTDPQLFEKYKLFKTFDLGRIYRIK
jgi:hypothetical protein